MVQGGPRCGTKVRPVLCYLKGTYHREILSGAELALRPERQYPFQYKHFPYYSHSMSQLSEFINKDGVLRSAKGQNGKDYPGITLPMEMFIC